VVVEGLVVAQRMVAPVKGVRPMQTVKRQPTEQIQTPHFLGLVAVRDMITMVIREERGEMVEG
jgi:hypothetical protein